MISTRAKRSGKAVAIAQSAASPAAWIGEYFAFAAFGVLPLLLILLLIRP